ncbi:MAG: outer membrane protein assembly factor BamA [Bacteroidia bacterium]
MKLFSVLIIVAFTFTLSSAQIGDYSMPSTYTIKGIEVSGDESYSSNVVIAFSGLTVGEEIKIPGNEIANAIRKLWKQNFFSVVEINADSVDGRDIYLNIYVETSPRLAQFTFEGLNKSQSNKLRDELNIKRGDIVTRQLRENTSSRIKNYYIEKGRYFADVEIVAKPDSLFNNNSVRLIIHVDRGERIRIKEIEILGNDAIPDKKLEGSMRETREKQFWNPFRSSKFIPQEYENDKRQLISYYNSEGYRDASIITDSVYRMDEKNLKIDITVKEGDKYYYRDIAFTGNTKYSTKMLMDIIGIDKGDVYNPTLLERNLSLNPEGYDVSSLYMDNGYLFFRYNVVEVGVENDSIDIEIRIMEGPQATVSRVTVSGNTKTHDHVILREIRTRPGDKFNRSDIIRSTRELAQLGYFDQELLDVAPKPNPEDGTVELEYKVVEKSTDQIEFQGGWGAGQVIGTIGLSFNNFSIQDLFNKDAWKPIPSGNGQRISLRASSNGRFYQNYSFSFTEPWFGGRKPNALTTSFYHSSFTPSGLGKDDSLYNRLQTSGATLGLGKRLKWPDDWFTLYQAISYQRYSLRNYSIFPGFSNGTSNNINYNFILSRNSLDGTIWINSGSSFSIAGEIAPPYSLFSDKIYETPAEKYKWLEYHKWSFDATWYAPVIEKFVLKAEARFGFLGLYNRELGITPFERYELGGDGLSNINLDGRDIIALRGYANGAVTPTSTQGATIFDKFTLELRYPLSLNPSATIYGLIFAEAGNSFMSFDEYSPFEVKRSAGVGVRIFLPFFGLFGVDYGFPFDQPHIGQRNRSGEFHLSIGQQF